MFYIDNKSVNERGIKHSHAGDSLHVNDVRAAARRRNFRYRPFSEGGAHAMMIDPANWAEIAARFVEEAN